MDARARIRAILDSDDDQRGRAQAAIGPQSVKSIASLAEGLRPADAQAIQIHPAITRGDLIWLEPECEAVIASIQEILDGLDLSDGSKVGALRGKVARALAGAERAYMLVSVLALINDAWPDGDKASPAVGSASILRSAVQSLGEIAQALTAPTSAIAARHCERFVEISESMGAMLAGIRAPAGSATPPRPSDLIERAFDVKVAPEICTRQQFVWACQALDPFNPPPRVESPLFPNPPPGAHLAPIERLLVVAERQLRCIGVPRASLTFAQAQDCLQMGWRLAFQPLPILAHVSGQWTAHLIAEAGKQSGEATRDRLARLHDEDAPLLMTDAPRADAALSQATSSPREALVAYRTLTEAVVRPWLRLLLDLRAIRDGLPPPSLPATVELATLRERVVKAGGVHFGILAAALDPQMRNPDAHQRVMERPDGTLAVYGPSGRIEREIDPRDVRGRYDMLRSAFAGVDCAFTVFVYAWGIPVTVDIRKHLSLAVLQRLVEVAQLSMAQPAVRDVAVDSRVLTVRTEAPWAPTAVAEVRGALVSLLSPTIEDIRFVAR